MKAPDLARAKSPSKASVRSNRAAVDPPRRAARGHPLLERQQGVGNQAMQRMLRKGAVQAKLKVGQPGDAFEQEADQIALAVMRMPDRRALQPPIAGRVSPISVQRTCAACKDEEESRRSFAGNQSPPEVWESVQT